MIKIIDDSNKNDIKVEIYCKHCGKIILNSSYLQEYHDGDCANHFWMKATNSSTIEEYRTNSDKLHAFFNDVYFKGGK